jgi:galactonate dehydratase
MYVEQRLQQRSDDTVKITDLRIFVVDADWRDWIFIKLYTDEGLTGVGEAGLSGGEAMVVAALDRIKTYLLGKSPFDIEQHWREIYHGSFWRGPALTSALGAVEIALWDIVGKACNMPIYNLLGGRCRDRVRCYTHISEATSGHTIDQRVAEARAAVDAGWTALKWDPLPANFLTLQPREKRFVVDQVSAVREAVGDDVELLVELHGRLDPETAIRLAAALEPYRPYFLEEPVPPDSLDALAKVASQVRVPLATGERLVTKYGFWPLLERQLVSTIQPDVIHVGGLLECKKIAAMAEARYMSVAPHNPNGPVATVAALHLAANLPNLSILEMPADDYLWSASWRDELLVDASLVQVKQGYLELPTAPGLGIDIDEAAIAAHPPKGRQWASAIRVADHDSN